MRFRPKRIAGFLILIVIVLLFSGCTYIPTPNQSTKAATLIPEPTIIQDPIVGVWRYSDAQGFDYRVRFFANGTMVETVSDKTMNTWVIEKWTANGDNSYAISSFGGGRTISNFIYDSSKNVIYGTDFRSDTTPKTSLMLIPYEGDVMPMPTPNKK